MRNAREFAKSEIETAAIRTQLVVTSDALNQLVVSRMTTITAPQPAKTDGNEVRHVVQNRLALMVVKHFHLQEKNKLASLMLG